MKKITLILISILLIISYSINAQDDGKKQKIGIRAGFHSAAMVYEGSKPDTAKSLSSFYVGLFRDNKIAPILHFGTGIEYFQNGLKYTNNSKRVLHTLSIPLDLKVKLGPVFVLGGAAANFKVKEQIVIGDNKNNPMEGDKTKGFDIAAFAGAGVKILFISVEARYHWGLIDARNSLKHRYFQLGAAVSF